MHIYWNVTTFDTILIVHNQINMQPVASVFGYGFSWLLDKCLLIGSDFPREKNAANSKTLRWA